MSKAEQIRNVNFPKTSHQTKLAAEVAFNVLFGVVPLTDDEKKYFVVHKDLLRQLANQDVLWQQKRSILTREFWSKLQSAALRHLNG